VASTSSIPIPQDAENFFPGAGLLIRAASSSTLAGAHRGGDDVPPTDFLTIDLSSQYCAQFGLFRRAVRLALPQHALRVPGSSIAPAISGLARMPIARPSLGAGD
jgi:hypothetical protein